MGDARSSHSDESGPLETSTGSGTSASGASDSARRIYKVTYVPDYFGDNQSAPPGPQPALLSRPLPRRVPLTRMVMLLRQLTSPPGIALASLKSLAKDGDGTTDGATPNEVMHDLAAFLDARKPSELRDAFGSLLGHGREKIGTLISYIDNDVAAGIADVDEDEPDAKQLRAWAESVRSVTAAISDSEKRAQPFGVSYLERLDFLPLSISRGEFLSSVPIAPNETSYVITKVWSTTTTEFEKIVTDSFEDYSETGVSEKSDLSQSTESQSKHEVTRDVSVSADATNGVVTVAAKGDLKTDDGSSTASKESAAHSMSLTKKASSRAKKDRKVSIKATQTQGASAENGQRFSNPDPVNPIRVDYFELLKNWEVRLVRYGARLVFDVVLPSPGAELLRQHVEVAALQKLLAEPFVFDVKQDTLDDAHAAAYGAQFSVSVQPPPPLYLIRSTTFTLPVDPSGNTIVSGVDIPCPDGYVIDGGPLPLGTDGQPDVTKLADHSYAGIQGAGMGAGGSFNFVGSANNGLVQVLGGGILPLDFIDGVSPVDGKISVVAVYGAWATLGGVLHVRFKLSNAAYKQWQSSTWSALRDAAAQQFSVRQGELSARLASIQQRLAAYDPLTLRSLEREAVKKEAVRWILGPGFDFLPADLGSVFTVSDEVTASLASGIKAGADEDDPYMLSGAYELDYETTSTQGRLGEVLVFGDHIRFLQDVFEWENMMFMPYPYFWDAEANWPFKRDFYHGDYTHRTFLRAGAVRVLLPIRVGFEAAFLRYQETGILGGNGQGGLDITREIFAQNAELSSSTLDGDGGYASEGGIVIARWNETTPTNSLDIDVVQSKAIVQ